MWLDLRYQREMTCLIGTLTQNSFLSGERRILHAKSVHLQCSVVPIKIMAKKSTTCTINENLLVVAYFKSPDFKNR